MKIVSRLICVAVGHKPYQSMQVSSIPKPKQKPVSLSGFVTANANSYINGTNSINQQFGVSSPATSLNNAYPNNQISSVFNITSLPLNAKLIICSRCNQVYWKTELNQIEICSVQRLPELKELHQLRERVLWEEKQRTKNSVANKLYNQYLIALKLAYKEEDDEE